MANDASGDLGERLELAAAELRQVCDPGVFSFQSTAELEPFAGVIGQERAVRAIQFGLDIGSPGYNVFIAGIAGTGKSKIVQTLLEQWAAEQPVPEDWIYVHNFDDAESPRALSLPAGLGARLHDDMQELVEDLQERVPKAFEGKEYDEQRRRTIESYQERKQEKLQKLEDEARERGFELRSTPMGFRTIPIRDGTPLTQEEYQGMEEDQREELDDKMEELQAHIRDVLAEVKDIDQSMKDELKELNRQVALNVLGTVMHQLRERYSEHDQVLEHLEAVQADILDNIEDFREQEEQPQLPIPALAAARQQGSDMSRYKVNLVVDNSDREGAPVLNETNPTYNNLVGRIERRAQFGALFTDFTMIRGGALAKANGGYLLLHVEDVLRNPYAYDALKRALNNKEVQIEDLAERFGVLSTQTLRPEPIPLGLKVCLIGSPLWYHLLFAFDEEFRKIFKVKADFDYRTDRTEERVEQIAGFIAKLGSEEDLLPFTGPAVAGIVDESSRLVDDKQKLSLQFSRVADLIREASYWAADAEDDTVRAEHVRKAVDEAEFRASLAKERVQEYIQRDIMLVDTDGDEVGQINGLAVHMLGDYLFGRPSRITCNVALGREGVINIERRAGMSHSTHSKGVMILGGFIAERFAQDRPLALTATLVFEQSYSGVAGDSASSTELYVLLSALSGVPLRQGIAVTGSVNQKGEVQAIGGVNHKVEGFFDVCRERGLTGEQGVVVPKANAQHLMLRPDVVEAVEAGDFHVWAVGHVDEGIEILSGVRAGERDEDGTWTEGSINARVEQRLDELGKRLRDWSKDGGPAAGTPEIVTREDGEPPTPPPPPEPPSA